MKRYGSIYVATNTVTGEQYVGQTIMPVSYRVSNHKSNAKNPKTKFQKALNGFGTEAFSFVEVYAAFDIDALNEAECNFIAELAPVYNSTSGGSGAHRRRSEEERAAIAARAKARWANPEFRARAAASIRAACRDETRTERMRVLGKAGVGSRARWAGRINRDKVAKFRALSAKLDKVWSRLLQERKPKLSGIERAAKVKYKPVLYVEGQVTFLSQKFAAEYFGLSYTTISEALRKGIKVQRQHTLTRV